MGLSQLRYDQPGLWVIWTRCGARLAEVLAVLALLCAGALLMTQHVVAQEENTHQGVTCGQTRLVVVRFLDGTPVPGVEVILSATAPVMGGPELYMRAGSGQPTASEGGQDGVGVTPHLPTPDRECHPVITGTLTAVTDPQGLARFDRLGEGTWMLRFEGETTHGRQTAYIVATSVQGRFPYGRTREGGGFIERVDALNEEGGPNPGPVQPGTGPSTSRYLLQFSAEYGGWLPGLDLATEDGVPPLPLAGVKPGPMATPMPMTTPEGTYARVISGTGNYRNTDNSMGGPGIAGSAPQESAFDPSSVKVMPSQDQAFTESGGQRTGVGVPPFNIWWAGLRYAPLLGLTLGGIVAVVAIVWGRRRASAANMRGRGRTGRADANKRGRK